MQIENLTDTVSVPAPEASHETTYQKIEALTTQIAQSGFWLAPLKHEMRQAIIGQDHLLERLLVCLLSGGHMLLETRAADFPAIIIDFLNQRTEP